MTGEYLFYRIDPYYLLYMIPALIITLAAQIAVQSAYRKYSLVAVTSRMTGAQAAERVLRYYGVTGVTIEPVSGTMTDHFDPKSGVIRLSEGVFSEPTISAVCIAAHEAGHAAQYDRDYTPIRIRAALLPVANIGSQASIYLVLAGLLFSFRPLMLIGIALFSFSVLFQLVTLPVEFNASSSAMKALEEEGILVENELSGGKKVLRAAAMTYVAAVAVSLLNLLRLVMIARRKRD